MTTRRVTNNVHGGPAAMESLFHYYISFNAHKYWFHLRLWFNNHGTGRRGPYMNKMSVVLKKRLSLLFKTNTENDEDGLFGAVRIDGRSH